MDAFMVFNDMGGFLKRFRLHLQTHDLRFLYTVFFQWHKLV